MIFKNRLITRLHIEASSRCHLKCPQCPRTLGELENPYLIEDDLSLQRVMELISIEDVMSLERVIFSGNYGDPLMNNELLDLIEYFNNNSNIEIHVNTNASLRNEEYFKQLANKLNSKSIVIFGVDGLEDTHHIYRRGSNWKKIIKNIKSFTSNGGKATWSHIVFEHNKHQIYKAKDLSKSLGCFSFHVRYTKRVVHHTVQWLKPVKFKNDTNFIISDEIRCEALRDQSIFINSQGMIYPCCHLEFAKTHPSNIEEYSNITLNELHSYPTTPRGSICKKICGIKENDKSACWNQTKEIINLT